MNYEHEKWWAWNWDCRSINYPAVQYKSITSWRRGWITLYKMVDLTGCVEWRLYLPFNLNIGIQL